MASFSSFVLDFGDYDYEDEDEDEKICTPCEDFSL